MAAKKLTSREFNQDTGGAKRAAQHGPVYITDRGRLSHVLLTFEDYQRLDANRPGIAELLADPPGVEDIEFSAPVSSDAATAADFD
ncbi:MAG: type II toxin-antitoxin system Phd/YefM family antitoxin [Acidimicrobiia bacterium]|nr:type II toxin-antitoxin system Phd/YefM family antitoxin [Acidimicrobiia bacterium]